MRENAKLLFWAVLLVVAVVGAVWSEWATWSECRRVHPFWYCVNQP